MDNFTNQWKFEVYLYTEFCLKLKAHLIRHMIYILIKININVHDDRFDWFYAFGMVLDMRKCYQNQLCILKQLNVTENFLCILYIHQGSPGVYRNIFHHEALFLHNVYSILRIFRYSNMHHLSFFNTFR